MSTDHIFRLQAAAMGVVEENGKRTAVTIPAGAVVTLVAGPSPRDSAMVDVLWEGRACAMFLVDMQNRGEEVLTPQTSS